MGELRIRNAIEGIYIQKTREVINGMRSATGKRDAEWSNIAQSLNAAVFHHAAKKKGWRLRAKSNIATPRWNIYRRTPLLPCGSSCSFGPLQSSSRHQIIIRFRSIDPHLHRPSNIRPLAIVLFSSLTES